MPTRRAQYGAGVDGRNRRVLRSHVGHRPVPNPPPRPRDDTADYPGDGDTLDGSQPVGPLGPGLGAPGEADGIDEELMRRSIKRRLFGEAAHPIKIGRFTVLRKLGEGGMGAVYAAYDDQLDRKIAIKVLSLSHNVDPHEGTTRLMREAQAMARLSHPNVVQVYEVGRDAGQIFLAMQFIEGTTLQAWVAAEKRSWRDIVDKYAQAGRGLAAAHRAGIIHRDFKPANVLLDAHGTPRVGDFGTARGAETAPAPQDAMGLESSGGSSLHQRLTAPGAAIGTPAYMSPEQYMGLAIDARGDQFSFCAALWEALYGNHPFGGDKRTVLLSRALEGKFQEPPSGHGVPTRVRRILQRGLDAHPDHRFPDMDSLLAALERASRPRTRWFVAAGIAVAAMGAALIFVPGAANCDDAASELEPVWSADQHRTVTETLGAGTADALDAWADRWTTARVEACLDTHIRHTRSQTALEQRNACLDRLRTRLGAYMNVTGQGEAAAGTGGGQRLAGTLPDPEVCRRPELYAPAFPDDEELASAVAEVRDRIDRAAALEVMGNLDASLREAAAAHETAQGLQFPALEAEGLYQLGRTRASMGDAEGARRALDAAIDLGEPLRHDILVALAWTRLAELGADGRAPIELAHDWGRRARASVARLGSPPLMEAAALYHFGRIKTRLGDLAEAEEMLKRALALRETELDPDSPPAREARNALAALESATANQP